MDSGASRFVSPKANKLGAQLSLKRILLAYNIKQNINKLAISLSVRYELEVAFSVDLVGYNVP